MAYVDSRAIGLQAPNLGGGSPGMDPTRWFQNNQPDMSDTLKQSAMNGINYDYQRKLADLQLKNSLASKQQTLAMLRQNFPTLFEQQQATAFNYSPGPQPTIPTSPIWNEGQIQQQVNASRAANDAATQGRTRRMAESMGARGYGSNSPLAQALSGSYQAQNMFANTGNERETRMKAAGENANYNLASAAQAERQYAARNAEALQKYQIDNQKQNILLQAIQGFM